MKWAFTPDEFAYVWRETGFDRLPSPLELVTTARTEDAAARLRSAAAERYPSKGDPELSAALRVAATPSTHIKLVSGETRVAGCAVNGTAVVIIQAGNVIRLSLIHEAALPQEVAEVVPEIPAGRRSAIRAPAARLFGDYPVEVMVGADDRSLLGPMRALLRAQRMGEGYVAVHRFADTEFPPKPHFLSWMDIAGDGRYLVRSGIDVEIRPATRSDIRVALTK